MEILCTHEPDIDPEKDCSISDESHDYQKLGNGMVIIRAQDGFTKIAESK